MREIKFRAWEKTLKEIIPVRNIDFEKRMINTTSAWRLFDEIEIMQYTGLKDKNGKEIYEGDIIAVDCDCDPGDYAICAHPPLIAYVEWLSENASFDLRGKNGPANMEFEDCYQDVYTVVGNIYENPELLEHSAIK